MASGRVEYGLDAPGPFFAAVAAGVVALVVGLTVFAPLAFLGGAGLLYSAGHLWASRVGKIRVARRLLDRVEWRGDEHVLDVGCGHGLLLIEAAKHLTTGRAVGIDIWSQKDQWHNSAEATLDNAARAGVADRVDVQEGDARALPFDDAQFDVVTSSLVIHNISDRDERARAIGEMARVLRPGGRVIIVDIAATADYVRALRGGGMTKISRSRPLPLFLPTARVVTAQKD